MSGVCRVRLPPAACIMNHFIIIIITIIISISSATARRRHGHCQKCVQTIEKLNIVFTSRSANNKLTGLSEQNIAHVPSAGSQRTACDERFAHECRNKETKKRFCGIKRATGCVPRCAQQCAVFSIKIFSRTRLGCFDTFTGCVQAASCVHLAGALPQCTGEGPSPHAADSKDPDWTVAGIAENFAQPIIDDNTFVKLYS